MTSVNVSIIICTRDNAASLKMTLDSVALATVAPGLYVEMLVIDNGDLMETKALVEGFVLPYGEVRYVREPRKGKGYAYNAGLAAARGEVLLFTDDDVRVPREWIGRMCQPILTGEADAIAGGVVFPPEIEKTLRSSSLEYRRGWFASTEHIDPQRPDRMVGANMAFSRRVLEKVPGFDLELGPGALGFDDETLFSRQLMDAGFELIGALDVTVEHHFNTSRLSEEFVQNIARRMGASHGYMAWHWEQQDITGAKWRLNWLRAKFSIRKFIRPLFRESKSTADLGDWWYLQHIAFHEQLLKESRQPRKYSPRGARWAAK